MSSDTTRVIPVTVQIFGREYSVACPAGEEQALFKSAKLVDSEMRKVRSAGKVVGTDRIAVMISLNMAHELLRSQAGVSSTLSTADISANNDGEDQERINHIHEILDQALQRYQSYLP